MTANIIDGKARAAQITDDVAARVRARLASGRPAPGLAVVLVGEHAASQIYVRNKRRITDEVGMQSLSFDLSATTTQQELLALIDRLNADPAVQGILVQLPLPAHIDRRPRSPSACIPTRTSTAFIHTTSAGWS